MNTKLYYCLLVAGCLFAACKKEEKPQPVTTKTITATIPQDSISFTISGKNYYVNTVTGGGQGSASANNVETYVNQQYNSSKSADTALFFNNIMLSNTTSGAASGPVVELSFFRKFSLPSFINGNMLTVSAADQSKLYTPGNYTFATDYMRGNFLSGVGILVSGLGASYSLQLLGQPTTITQNMQNNSSFVVSSFTKVKSYDTGDKYVLIGKFNATLFDSNEQPAKLTNGYIRVLVDVYNYK